MASLVEDPAGARCRENLRLLRAGEIRILGEYADIRHRWGNSLLQPYNILMLLLLWIEVTLSSTS